MARRLFYVMYIGDTYLQGALDAIRIIANPGEKGKAHVTARGPYPEDAKVDVDKLRIEGATVRITGVGDFFCEGQNTVFLECSSSALRDAWDKGDFAYRPHITLYDGVSSSFAARLAKLLRAKPLRCGFPATRLSPLVSEKGVKRDDLWRAAQSGLLSSLTDLPLGVDDLAGLSPTRRLALISRIWEKLLRLYSDEPSLWGPPESSSGGPRADAADNRNSSILRELRTVVCEAYERMRCDMSIDRIIADPARYAEFVATCWKLGAQADQSTLGRTLLNVRKAGAIGTNPLLAKFSIPRNHLDQYLTAAEVAIRIVQDEEWFKCQRYVGLDTILCHPFLSARFLQFASQLAPGHSSVDYRWAALVLRKSGRRHRGTTDVNPAVFIRVGKLDSIRVHSLPENGGLVWLREGNCNLYFGESGNVRRQVSHLIEYDMDRLPIVQPRFGVELARVEIAVAEMPRLSSTDRTSLKRLFVEEHAPRMNMVCGKRQSA